MNRKIYSEEKTRAQIQKLYEKNPEIHISISYTKPRLVLKNEKANIVGVYLHFFLIEEYTHGKAQRHCIRYADLIPNLVDILELNENN